MVQVIEPEEGMEIYDPTVGSGGMLIQSHQYVQETGGDSRDLALYGQEDNGGTWSICKMNMILHGINSADIRKGDTIADPQHFDEGGELKRFDRVIANPPFSQNYSQVDLNFKDRFHTFMPESGKKADLMFVQHMVASLKSNGRMAVVMPHGVLFRGWVMSEWSQVTIGECCEILDSQRIPVNGEERSKRIGPVPYYGANGLQGYIDDYIFDEPLILMAEDGGNFDEFATRSIAYRVSGQSWVNNHAHVLRATKSHDQSFVFYCLEHKDVTPFIKGGTRAKLNQLELRQVSIQSPPLPQQRKIARILTTVDNLIEQTEALIEKYKSIKQGMMHDLFTRGVDSTGQLRPPYEDAPQLYKRSPLGWIPKEWNVQSFGDLASYVNGNSFNALHWTNAGLPIIRIQNLNGEMDFNYYTGQVNPKWKVQTGDLLFAWSGMRETSFGPRIWKGPLGVLNQHIFKVTPNPSRTSTGFLSLLLRFHLEEIAKSAHGFKSSFVHVTRSEVTDVRIGVPDLEEQNDITERINALDALIDLENEGLQNLQQTKTGLMQDLLTGKVRVKVDEAEEVTADGQSKAAGYPQMKRTYKDIQYTLTRSKRRTGSIHIERDGQVSILVPNKLSDADVDGLIENKLVWIYKNLAEWCDLNATQIEREFVNGEGFLYLGRSYRLKLVEDQSAPLVLKNGYFCLRTDSNGSQVDAHEVFKDFYRDKALKKISQQAEFYAARMGVTPRGIKVQELQHRWASCTRAGMLNFHWKCMMAPLTILDYIVVHELAHLIHANHTEAFWNEVDKVLPDYLDRKQWLRVNGAGMSL